MLVRASEARRGGANDFRNARECLETAFPNDLEEQQRQAQLWEHEVRQLVWGYSPAIVALAAALLQRRVLSGRAVRRIVRSMPRMQD